MLQTLFSHLQTLNEKCAWCWVSVQPSLTFGGNDQASFYAKLHEDTVGLNEKYSAYDFQKK